MEKYDHVSLLVDDVYNDGQIRTASSEIRGGSNILFLIVNRSHLEELEFALTKIWDVKSHKKG